MRTQKIKLNKKLRFRKYIIIGDDGLYWCKNHKFGYWSKDYYNVELFGRIFGGIILGTMLACKIKARLYKLKVSQEI